MSLSADRGQVTGKPDIGQLTSTSIRPERGEVKGTPCELRLSEAHQAIAELPTVVGRRASSATGSCQESICDPVESTRDAPAGLAPNRNYSANGAGHDPR